MGDKIIYDRLGPVDSKDMEINEFTSIVIKRIEDTCKEQNVSLYKLLKKHRWLNKFERWKHHEESPEIKHLGRIANELNVSIHYLITGIDVRFLNLSNDFDIDLQTVSIANSIRENKELSKIIDIVINADPITRRKFIEFFSYKDIDAFDIVSLWRNNYWLKSLVQSAKDSPSDNISQAIKVLNTSDVWEYTWEKKREYRNKSLSDFLPFIKRFISLLVPFAVFTALLIGIGTAYVNDHLEDSYEKDLKTFNTKMSEYEKEKSNYKAALDSYNAEMDEINAFKETTVVPIEISADCSMTGGEPVGNEIDYDLLVNDIDCQSTKEMEYKIGDDLNFDSTVTDNEKIPDTDSADDTISLNVDDLKEGYTFEQKMYPHETRGKFAGNTAEYTAKYHIQLKDGFNADVLQEDPSRIVEPEAPTEPVKPDIAKPAAVVPIHGFQLLKYNNTFLIIFLIEFGLFIWIAAYFFFKGDDF